MARALALPILAAALACTTRGGGLDAAVADAAHVAGHDAAVFDAGEIPDAAGPADAAQAADAAVPDGGVIDAGRDAGTVTDAGAVDAAPPACPSGVICVDSFPFHHAGDTSTAPAGTLDRYSCAPNTDESGPEIVFAVDVPADGFLSVAVYDAPPGIDIDVHILSARSAASCLDRGNHAASADVTRGRWWVVADTYGGATHAGVFTLDIGFVEPSRGPCDMETGTMPRVNDNGTHLAMPATGPVVLEAHLVTQAEPSPYPSTSTDELAAHYALSQATTKFVMYRTQVWAPLEGGTFYGAGIGSPTLFPVIDEGWYVNMYWTSAARPARGTRMILRDPSGGSRAVVVAAGYETGPGDLSHVGGTPEETHFYMGTTHGSRMTLGIAVDPGLPLGPRVCQ